MVKRVHRALGLALVVALLGLFGLGPASFGPAAQVASAAPYMVAGTWTSGFQVMNVDTVDAQVTVKYYPNPSGTMVQQGPDTILVGKSKTYYNTSMAVSPGFVGSVVVESTAKVAAITNLISSTPNMSGSYNGVSNTATSFYLPLIMRANSGWYTVIYVQNADTSSADVTLTFQRAGATTTTVNKTIAAGSMEIIDQSTMSALIPTPWVGSVTISSTKPVAAVVNEINESAQQLMVYSGFPTGAAKIYAPLLQHNNGGWVSGVQVQLVAGTTGTVTLYANGVSVGTANLDSIGKSATFYPVPAPAVGTKVSSGYIQGPIGSQLVGIVNQLNIGAGQATSYGMFSSGTSRVVAPLLMLNNSGFYTGFQFQNIGTSSAPWTMKVDGTTVTVGSCANPLPAGSACTVYPIPSPSAGWKVGSGEVSSTDASAQLVGIVNEICVGGSCASGDNSMTYEGINP